MIEHNGKEYENTVTVHEYHEDGAFIEIASKFDCAKCNCSILATRFMKKGSFTTEEEVNALAEKLKLEHLELHRLADLGDKFGKMVGEMKDLWKEAK